MGLLKVKTCKTKYPIQDITGGPAPKNLKTRSYHRVIWLGYFWLFGYLTDLLFLINLV